MAHHHHTAGHRTTARWAPDRARRAETRARRTRRAAQVEQYWAFVAYTLVTVTTGAYVVVQLTRVS